MFSLLALIPPDSCLDNSELFVSRKRVRRLINVCGTTIYMVLMLVVLIHFCSKGLTFGLVSFNENLPPRKAGKWQYPPREWKT